MANLAISCSSAALLLLAACSPQTETLDARAQGPSTERPSTERASREPLTPPDSVLFVGHSLLSDVPDLVAHVAKGAGQPFAFREQSIPGASLRWQWDEAERAKAPDYRSPFEPRFQALYADALASGEHDALVLVDSVPRGGRKGEAETVEYLVRFTELARRTKPEVRVLFYEPWHCIDSGTPQGCEYDKGLPTTRMPWRERVDADGAMWARIVVAANDELPAGSRPIELVPAARALGRLADAVERGEIDGVPDWRALFVDDIHASPLTKLYLSLVTHGALFGATATGVPAEAANRWGKPYFEGASAPTPATLRRLEALAAEALAL